MGSIRIHDTVHGYIEVPDNYVDRFVDTIEFQRLRRIEQTSIRSLFPTARHDRFVHSLGVYFVGRKIVEHFMSMAVPSGAEAIYHYLHQDAFNAIEESFKIACLLHDVGHAPFSHTFEGYYDNQNKLLLAERLNEALQNNKLFLEDHNCLKKGDGSFRPNYHEYASAIVAAKQYEDAISACRADRELVARMIIGCKYQDDGSLDTQIKNIFIDLVHGDIIDADRLDYACRDIWASGYCTSSIDLERLIHAMQIRLGVDGKAVLCYDSKVVNEIESVLAVRDFQCAYIINHHTIVYDQYVLRRAAEIMACGYYAKADLPLNDYNNTELDDRGYALKALGKIISVDALLKEMPVGNSGLTVANIADEDLLYLMKLNKDGNPYYKEWASRCYDYFPLWKNPDEFYQFFEIARPRMNGDYLMEPPSFDKFKEVVVDAIGGEQDDEGRPNVVVEETTIKGKVPLSQVYLVVNGEVLKYQDLYPMKVASEKGAEYRDRKFYFVYYKGSTKKIDREQRVALRNEVVGMLKEPINQLYNIKKLAERVNVKNE